MFSDFLAKQARKLAVGAPQESKLIHCGQLPCAGTAQPAFSEQLSSPACTALPLPMLSHSWIWSAGDEH